MKKNTYPPEVLAGFKPVQRTDGEWAIELAPGRFLHWIETTDYKPVTGNRADFVMQHWTFQAQAWGMIEYLRHLWSENSNPINESAFKVTVTLDDDGKEILRKV